MRVVTPACHGPCLSTPTPSATPLVLNSTSACTHARTHARTHAHTHAHARPHLLRVVPPAALLRQLLCRRREPPNLHLQVLPERRQVCLKVVQPLCSAWGVRVHGTAQGACRVCLVLVRVAAAQG
jgi:hypothetical protein